MMRVLGAMMALCLLAEAARAESVWIIGNNNNAVSEFESEADADDLFYRDAGTYTGVSGYNVGSGLYDLAGGVAVSAEPWINAGSTTEGFERSMAGTTTERAINIFFHLAPTQALAGAKYQFDAKFLGSSLASDGSHDFLFSMNGTTFLTESLAHSTVVTVRAQFDAAAVSAAAGANVLSLVRTGGTASYSNIDFLSLRLVEPTEVFHIGIQDNTQTEFEQEGGGRVDAKFYWETGDYTGVVGQSGAGANVGAGERLIDGTSGDGFVRALTSGATTSDVFFQLTADEVARGSLRYRTSLISRGAGSSHDLEFSMNGTAFLMLTNVAAATPVDVEFDAATVGAVAGGNVVSVRRTGGGTTSPWIQFDFMQLDAVPEPSTGLLILVAGGLLALRRRRA